MFFRFNETSKKCDAAKPYLIPVASGETYSFVVPKSDIPEPADAALLIGFEDCAGNVYPVRDLPLTDGSECNYIDRTAVAYFRVKRISPFNCQADEIIIYDANETFDCAEKYLSAILSPGDPQGFGSGLRAYYGIDPVPGYGQYFRSVQDYIDYLVFVSAIPGANSPYYGTMTDLGGGLVKWEIPEPDFITAFGHSPNEVKLSFCSNGGNTFEIEVLQDFKTCFTDDPNSLHGCGIAWAR
ncbi:MAG TPA: hypothetical protein PKE69_27145, partial [Pyrinomonadaceae bacterium]|nr:hypothetical protein [Pyrinomonadaceae bacterium]